MFLRNATALHLEILRQDFSFALRTIRRAPALSVIVAVITALGIGATTAAFSLADHVLIRPLPYRDSERLVKLWQGGRLQPSPAHYRDWKNNSTSFDGMAAFNQSSANLVGVGDPVRLNGALATGDLFAVLGASALVGRTITLDDDRESSPSTVVISHRLWRDRFAESPAAIGTAVVLNERPRVIVGVMPPGFRYPSRSTDFWIPFQFTPNDYEYGNPFLEVVARLKPGVSLEQAQAEMGPLALAINRRVSPNAQRPLSASVIALRDEISGQSRLLLWCLLAAAGVVLLIACTNLANLLLTRGLGRQKELAVRAALGAGRQRLIRQMLTESFLLAGAGGAAGVAMATLAMPTLARLVPAALPVAEMPSVDLRVLALAIIATMSSAVGFGLMPALRVARHAHAGALREGARAGVSRRTERLRSVLVVAQVGASVVLLVSCGLLLRAMLQVQGTSAGFAAEGALTLTTALPLPKYEVVAERHRFFDSVLQGVRALPGVSSAGYGTGLPLAMKGMIWSVSIPDQPTLDGGQRTVSLRFVTPGFFAALGMPMRAGRDVSDADTMASQAVAVVSESFAQRFWPGQDPLGRRFRALGALRSEERIVVGVVGDVRFRGLERPSEPQLYLPSRQVRDGSLIAHIPKELVVRASVPPVSLVPAIRTIVARADPQQPISDIQLVTDIVDAETAPRQIQVRVLAAFALIAFLLAGIGLHGLLAYNVSQRTREIGVRMALGAERLGIFALMMRRGLVLAALGIVLGGALALGAGRLLQGLLAGVSPTDQAAFGGAVGLAVLMTIAGSILPAARAVRVDPIEVIRSE
jgi:predicted permease